MQQKGRAVIECDSFGDKEDGGINNSPSSISIENPTRLTRRAGFLLAIAFRATPNNLALAIGKKRRSPIGRFRMATSIRALLKISGLLSAPLWRFRYRKGTTPCQQRRSFYSAMRNKEDIRPLGAGVKFLTTRLPMWEPRGGGRCFGHLLPQLVHMLKFGVTLDYYGPAPNPHSAPNYPHNRSNSVEILKILGIIPRIGILNKFFNFEWRRGGNRTNYFIPNKESGSHAIR